MLLLTADFDELCKKATIYLDTNGFIYAADNTELNDLYIRLVDKCGTVFMTLNSVEYEFTRGARTLRELTDRRDYVRSLASVLNVNRLLDNDKNDAFSVAMSLTVKSRDSQYTDFLLAVAMHAYRNGVTRQYILSADARAFPMDVFAVVGAITFSTKVHGVIHMNLYELDERKYVSLLKNIS